MPKVIMEHSLDYSDILVSKKAELPFLNATVDDAIANLVNDSLEMCL